MTDLLDYIEFAYGRRPRDVKQYYYKPLNDVFAAQTEYWLVDYFITWPTMTSTTLRVLEVIELEDYHFRQTRFYRIT